MQTLKALILVFIGGGAGSALRYLLSKWLNPLIAHFYIGTFSVNIIGCLVIGLISGWVVRTNYLDQTIGLLLITGFCGGFTTFSTFSLENLEILKSGELNSFFLYSLMSLITGIAAVMGGIWLSRVIA
ncbi:fluoride efflux transporter CrcB [Robertkochia flava]|uniref:fluoride efflux transporter CrcB n=1 Tax=Robertkochia flava TaxID=3447986 RepID=UPI001CCC27A4|nr:fluoride efflux transporter CrcB [Robertkochia marina]